jgi:hypothetical protein
MVLLGLLTVTGAALYADLPAVRRPRLRAAVVLVAALALAGAAGLLAWRAEAVGAGAAELAVVLAMLGAVAAGGPVATAVLRLAESPNAPPGTPSPANPLVLRGGAWIGVLERLAIGVSVLLQWPEGAVLALAVKGLGRYPELRTPGAAERFIIGTFASVLWACGCAGVGWALVH